MKYSIETYSLKLFKTGVYIVNVVVCHCYSTFLSVKILSWDKDKMQLFFSSIIYWSQIIHIHIIIFPNQNAAGATKPSFNTSFNL